MPSAPRTLDCSHASPVTLPRTICLATGNDLPAVLLLPSLLAYGLSERGAHRTASFAGTGRHGRGGARALSLRPTRRVLPAARHGGSARRLERPSQTVAQARAARRARARREARD